MTWVADLSALAEKATSGRLWDEENFLEACSPERVRALCELAEAAEYVVTCLLGERDRVGEFLPGIHNLNEALAALASLEPARKEET